MSSFLDTICVAEQRGENERKPEISSHAGCALSPVIVAEERALLNLLKFDSRVRRISRWNASGVSKRFVILVERPKRGSEDVDRKRHEDSADGEDN